MVYIIFVLSLYTIHCQIIFKATEAKQSGTRMGGFSISACIGDFPRSCI